MFKINRFILYTSILLFLIFSFSLPLLAQENEEETEERVFRNPFIEYVEPAPANNSNTSSTNPGNNTTQRAEPVITFADIKSGLPFQLDGIITSGTNRIAIVDTGDGVEFVRSSFEKDNYYISAINQDSIIVNNRGFTFQLRIGGEINER
ncbi:hypothetical protein C7957_10651 [Halanaerobium saccharolyticum]|uniref:Uncharacterized protein n=1 Tax=Halanaerobium saccharolyticum TaxID=43595 RepID=A0A4R6SD08_9FIRM|nr:hypothetical protein [Halanaerobium saccharolyticum]TDP96956.1 hypothetical protein C7957_10651 [Halanaerobium saccharolyticum]